MTPSVQWILAKVVKWLQVCSESFAKVVKWLQVCSESLAKVVKLTPSVQWILS